MSKYMLSEHKWCSLVAIQLGNTWVILIKVHEVQFFFESACAAILFHQGAYYFSTSCLDGLLRGNDSAECECEFMWVRKIEIEKMGREQGVVETVLVFAHSSGNYSLHANNCLDTDRPGVIHSPYFLCPSFSFHHTVPLSHTQQFLWWAHWTKALSTCRRLSASWHTN